MCTHWLIWCGNGENFRNSARFLLWGINTTKNTCGRGFVNDAQAGDILWFVLKQSQGMLLATAVFSHTKERLLAGSDSLITLTLTDNELGWTGASDRKAWDQEIHYTDLLYLENGNYLTHMIGPAPVRRYPPPTPIDVDLHQLHSVLRHQHVQLPVTPPVTENSLPAFDQSQWRVERKTRQNGRTRGRVDKYYYHLVDGTKCNSEKAARRHQQSIIERESLVPGARAAGPTFASDSFWRAGAALLAEDR